VSDFGRSSKSHTMNVTVILLSGRTRFCSRLSNCLGAMIAHPLTVSLENTFRDLKVRTVVHSLSS